MSFLKLKICILFNSAILFQMYPTNMLKHEQKAVIVEDWTYLNVGDR